jgi:plastocyanin
MYSEQAVSSNVAWQAAAPFTWRKLLQVVSVIALAVLVAMGIGLRDRLPLGLAVVIALGFGLLRFRSGWPGQVVLSLVFADIALWTVSAAVMNAAQGEELVRLLLPASVAALSSAGLVAAVAGLVQRRNPAAGGRAARFVGLGALAFFVLAVGAGLAAPRAAAPATQAAPLVVATENMLFSTPALTADGEQVTVVVDNHDLWWHTFTIDELSVNLQVPSSGRREVTFTAQPGTYAFYCAIPGHKALGMEGMLVVP